MMTQPRSSHYLKLLLMLSITSAIAVGCSKDEKNDDATCSDASADTEVQAGESAQAGAQSQAGTPTPAGETVCPESEACELCPEPVQCPGDSTGETRTLDLSQDNDNTYAWVKTRASLDPEEEVIFYWVGYVYAQQPKDQADYPRGNFTFEYPLFRFEGFNVARFVPDGAGGYVMLSREVSVYQDPVSNRIIDCWRNYLLPDQPNVSVLHVMNDPVNWGQGLSEFHNLGDTVNFYSDLVLAYRSPLADFDRYAPYSAADVYQSSELFNYYVKRADLENESIKSAPVQISWSRVGQYLPWMQMGDRPGNLVYQVRGYKLMGGLEELPEPLLNWTRDVAGEQFLHAPDRIPTDNKPNATSWRVFKEALDSGSYTPLCD